ncbi:MAG TPA: HD domain-containing phosphohydrolase [Gaiellaceae bacterium]|nr:HD domain-containing phosphohydrolase [Gaiellaceae bacterium]
MEPSTGTIGVSDAFDPAAFEPATAAAVVDALVRALELRDYRRGKFAETREHADRVTQLAARLAAKVAPELLQDPRFEHGCRLHDIGMLAVPDAVLLKRTALTPAELDEIREHPWLGERIVATVGGLDGMCRQVIGSHHERWDGNGYPRGQRGDEIALAARVFAIADSFDALTHEQPWRAALPVESAREELARGAGSHWDPDLMAVFLDELVSSNPAE